MKTVPTSREDRRLRQRLHYELAGGECWCTECVADGPVLLAVVIDEVFELRGITDQGGLMKTGGPRGGDPRAREYEKH